MSKREKDWEWAKKWIHVYCSEDGPSWVHPKIVEKITRIVHAELEATARDIVSKMTGGSVQNMRIK